MSSTHIIDESQQGDHQDARQGIRRRLGARREPASWLTLRRLDDCLERWRVPRFWAYRGAAARDMQAVSTRGAVQLVFTR